MLDSLMPVPAPVPVPSGNINIENKKKEPNFCILGETLTGGFEDHG
jgi:hypothetical protein